MSFFNNGSTVYMEESIEQLMNNRAIQPSEYEDLIEGALAIVADSVKNEACLMRAIGINEASYFAQTGKEYVYTEGTLSDIWKKVKSAILKIWEKIKGLFKKFVALFDKFFASDKDFVKKYKKRIMMAKVEDFSYEGYKFPGLEAEFSEPKAADFPGDTSFYEKEDAAEKVVNKFRGKLLGDASKEIESGEFAEELKDHFYGDKETLDEKDINVSKQIGYIENYGEAKKKVEKAKTAVDRFFKDLIRDLDDKDKTLTKDKNFEGDKEYADPTGKDDDENKHAGRDIVASIGYKRTIYTRECEAYATYTGAYLNALKERNRQARSICVKVMSKGGTLQKESTSFEYPAYGSSFLENVKFI